MGPICMQSYIKRKTRLRMVEPNHAGILKVSVGAITKRVIFGCSSICRTCGALQAEDIIELVAASRTRS